MAVDAHRKKLSEALTAGHFSRHGGDRPSHPTGGVSNRGEESRVIMPDGQAIPISAVVDWAGGGSGFTGANASKRRGYIVFPQLDTRREITSYSRKEMLKRARWLFNNVGFAKRIVKGISRHMGHYIPAPNTPDAEWNKLALQRFNHIANSRLLFDVTGKFNFNSYQRFLTRRWLIDGDLTTAFSLTEDSGTTQIAPYESHQIADPTNYGWQDDSNEWYDGVRVDRNNRHVTYRVIDMDDHSKFTDLDASVALMSTVWERAGQVRGVTPFHAFLNRMLDIQEITGDMMLGIKTSNLLGFYLAKDQEGMPFLGDGPAGFGGGIKPQYQNGDGNPVTDSGDAASKKTFENVFSGGAIPEFPQGMKPGVLHDDRPPTNQMDLLRWFIREGVGSFDFPSEALFEMGSLNGNTARLMKEDVQEALEDLRFDILLPFCQAYWYRLIGNEIESGRLREPTSGDWQLEVLWIPPKKKTIDRGNEGRLNLEELRVPGLRTLRRHLGEQQLDYRGEQGQWLDEIDELCEQAREKGWSEADITQLRRTRLAGAPGSPAPISDAEPPSNQRDEDEDDENEEPEDENDT